MSEYTKHIAKGSDEYLSLATKTSYVRDYLLSLNSRINTVEELTLKYPDSHETLLFEELTDLLHKRDRILADQNLCYTEEEIDAFEDGKLPPKDIFTQIANDANNSAEVRNAASDMASLEDSVADAKLAYEIDSAEFDKVVDATEEMLSVAGDVIDYDNPNLVKITPEDEERLRKANDAIKALNESPENVNLQDDAKKRAMYEIGKHPFSYALYAVKNDVREIVQNIREGRKAVKAAEGTMLDAIAASAMALGASVGGKMSDAVEMAVGAARHAGVEAGKLLNKAYTSASEMLEKAKENVLGLYRTINKKLEHIAEVMSLGAYSHTLEKIALKASVAETKENPSITDRLAIATMKLNQFELGYKAEDISDHIAELKKTAWGEDGKSFLEKSNEWVDNKMYQTEALGVDFKNELVDFKNEAVKRMEDASEKLGKALQGFGDRISLEANIARAKVQEASLNVRASVYKSGVFLLTKVHKLNEHRVANLFDKITLKDIKADNLREYISNLENGLTPATERATFVPDKDLVSAIEALRRIENKSTAEMFAEKTLVNRLEKAEMKFEMEQDEKEASSALEREAFDTEYNATMKELAGIEGKIERLEDTVANAQQRGDALLDKMGSWDKAKNDLEQKAAASHNKIEDLKSQRSNPIQQAFEKDNDEHEMEM